MYHVNEDYADNAVTIHFEPRCPFKGTKERKKKPENGEWHGPFSTHDAAIKCARKT